MSSLLILLLAGVVTAFHTLPSIRMMMVHDSMVTWRLLGISAMRGVSEKKLRVQTGFFVFFFQALPSFR